jgi:uncharacterized protein YndB with AHSA1/START domain
VGAEPVTASVYIDAPPDRVYQFFTRPEALTAWMGESADIDPSPGGRFEVDVKGTPVRGHFLRLDPPHRLVISWGYRDSPHLPPGASTVDVRLTPEGGGTRVELQHRDLPSAEHPGHASGWSHYLARLAIAGTGDDPGPDPGMPAPAPG